MEVKLGDKRIFILFLCDFHFLKDRNQSVLQCNPSFLIFASKCHIDISIYVHMCTYQCISEARMLAPFFLTRTSILPIPARPFL